MHYLYEYYKSHTFESVTPIDKRRYKVHLDFESVKDFNVQSYVTDIS